MVVALTIEISFTAKVLKQCNNMKNFVFVAITKFYHY